MIFLFVLSATALMIRCVHLLTMFAKRVDPCGGVLKLALLGVVHSCAPA